MTRYVVVGAGIVGLATAHRILLDRPDAAVTVLEKEDRTSPRTRPATTRASSTPASTTSPAASRRGCARPAAASMVDFCDAHGIPHETSAAS